MAYAITKAGVRWFLDSYPMPVPLNLMALGVLVGTLVSGGRITSATVSDVTLLGVAVTSASNMVGPKDSSGATSGVTVQ